MAGECEPNTEAEGLGQHLLSTHHAPPTIQRNHQEQHRPLEDRLSSSDDSAAKIGSIKEGKRLVDDTAKEHEEKHKAYLLPRASLNYLK